MMENKEKKLVVDDLVISFWTNQGMVRAVRGVSFELEEGETLAIVGESGSGKSVTNRAIMGILAGNGIINRGEIIYDGQDLTKIEEEEFHKIRGGRIGMIFQDPMSSLNPIMRIGKQITEGMIINGKWKKQRYKRYVHRSRETLMDARRERRRLIKEYHEEIKGPKRQIEELESEYRTHKKSMKRAVRRKRAAELKEKLQQEIAEQQAKLPSKEERRELKAELKKKLEANKGKIKPARKEYHRMKKEARQYVRDDWKKKKSEIHDKIQKVREDAKKNPDKKAQKEARKQISELKEELRRHKKVTRKEAKARALKIMREVGIPEPEKRFRQYPFQFSGGMRQRIVIAIALTADPDILICDEPTTALDVTIQQQILDLIKKLKEERNLSVIFITHDLGVVANMADRVAVMYAGKIVEIGKSDEIFYDPKHPYTWALLSSMPDLDTREERLSAIKGTPPNMLHPPKGDAFAERNEYAMKIDFEQEPPFFKISDTHYAATWLLHKDAPKVDPPEALQKRINKMLKNHEMEGAFEDGDSSTK